MGVYPGMASGRPASVFGGRSVGAFQKSFFDAPAIIAAMDKATRKAFTKFGAFVRRRAISSIRYREKTSAPGSPPSAHRSSWKKKTNRQTGVTKRQASSPLRDFLFFAFDKDSQTLVVGPALTNQKNALADRPIPEILERGGQVKMHEHLHTYPDGRQAWLRTDLRYRLSGTYARSAVGKPRRLRTARYPARPFMAPALAAELPNLAPMYANSF